MTKGSTSRLKGFVKRYQACRICIGLSLVVGMVVTFKAEAAASMDRPPLRGYAQVEWERKGRIYRFDQIILVESLETVQFETLDEFGQTLVRVTLHASDLPLRKISRQFPSLPIRHDDLIHFLLYKVPPSDGSLTVHRGEDGWITGIDHQTKRVKDRYRILYSDFRKVGERIFPLLMEVESRKSTLRILWQRVEIN